MWPRFGVPTSESDLMSKQTSPASTSIMTKALPLPSGSAAGTSWAPDSRAVNVTVVCFALATLPVARSPMAAISTTNHTRRFRIVGTPFRVWVALPGTGGTSGRRPWIGLAVERCA